MYRNKNILNDNFYEYYRLYYKYLITVVNLKLMYCIRNYQTDVMKRDLKLGHRQIIGGSPKTFKILLSVKIK